MFLVLNLNFMSNASFKWKFDTVAAMEVASDRAFIVRRKNGGRRKKKETRKKNRERKKI